MTTIARHIGYLGTNYVRDKGAGGMGFKDLHGYNISLLAKKYWRLHMNPNALWAKVLKGKDFPDCPLTKAKKGRSPSWIWSSILAGHHTIDSNARWQISNGKSVDFWRCSRWVPSAPGGVIAPTDTRSNFTTLLASQVIDHNNGVWKIRLTS